MTEAEWLGGDRSDCPDVTRDAMLDELGGRGSVRKLRLFACACCRLIGSWLVDERSRRAVEVAERFADGAATARDRQRAEADARKAVKAVAGDARATNAAWAACWAAAAVASGAEAVSMAGQTAMQVIDTAGSDWLQLAVAQCDLLRDIFGNPFRPPPAIDPAWLSWNDGTVRRLAQAAYEYRSLPDGHLDSARLAVLADALEEAGCTDASLLGHLRREGVHVRGCHAVDAVLGMG